MNHLSSYNSTPELDVLVIGGGIGGLSAARVLNEEKPDAKIALLEKEPEVGQGTSHDNHNTNTGHTGAFYAPGSLKATSAKEGFHWLRQYHDEKGLKRRDTGKIIAGTLPEDIGLLQTYFKQALANGQRPESVTLLDGDELRAEHEPFLSQGVTKGLLLEDCYLFDANGVLREMQKDLERAGVSVKTDHKVLDIKPLKKGWLVKTNQGEFIATHIVNQAGTHSDKIARMTGGAKNWKIMPVMGSYFQLDRAAEFRRAIYEPTRQPPFLGVHIMPGKDGKPFMGPDVFFSPYRERLGEETSHRSFAEWIKGPFENLIGLDAKGHDAFPNAAFYMGMLGSATGRDEVIKHFSMERFAQDVQRLVDPDKLRLDPNAIQYLRSGIRAQALDLTKGIILQDMEKEVIQNPNDPNSIAIHDKMPGSPGFTASVGKARWLVRDIL